MKIKLVKGSQAKIKKIRFQFEYNFHSYSPAIGLLQPTSSAPAAHLQRIYSASTTNLHVQRIYRATTANYSATTATPQPVL